MATKKRIRSRTNKKRPLNDTELSRVLLGCRKDAGYTQQGLEAVSGVGQSKISDYERGVVVPCYGTVEKLLLSCGVDPDEIEVVLGDAVCFDDEEVGG